MDGNEFDAVITRVVIEESASVMADLKGTAWCVKVSVHIRGK